MAFTTIELINPITGSIKEAPVGFSWTSLCFGIWPAILRGNFKQLFIWMLLSMVTFGLAVFVLPFMINKLHIKDLIGKGYKVMGVASGNIGEVEASLGMRLPTLDK